MQQGRERRILLICCDERSDDLSQSVMGGGFKASCIKPGYRNNLGSLVSSVDIILFDEVGFPKGDLYDLTRRIRQKCSLPIAVIQHDGGSPDSSSERTIYLEMGIDTVMTCPIGKEMVARLNALWRRAYTYPKDAPAIDVVTIGSLVLIKSERRVIVAGEEVHFAPKEYGVLLCMMERLGRLVSKERLAEEVWDKDIGVVTRTIEIHIGRVRTKIDSPGCPRIVTIHNYGYRMDKVQ